MTRADVLEAINYAQEGRYSHEQWLTWLVKARACCPDCRRWADESAKVAGDVSVQEEWVRKYDHILSVLRGLL
jgi:hypothetical protein